MQSIESEQWSISLLFIQIFLFWFNFKYATCLASALTVWKCARVIIISLERMYRKSRKYCFNGAAFWLQVDRYFELCVCVCAWLNRKILFNFSMDVRLFGVVNEAQSHGSCCLGFRHFQFQWSFSYNFTLWWRFFFFFALFNLYGNSKRIKYKNVQFWSRLELQYVSFFYNKLQMMMRDSENFIFKCCECFSFFFHLNFCFGVIKTSRKNANCFFYN